MCPYRATAGLLHQRGLYLRGTATIGRILILNLFIIRDGVTEIWDNGNGENATESAAEPVMTTSTDSLW